MTGGAPVDDHIPNADQTECAQCFSAGTFTTTQRSMSHEQWYFWRFCYNSVVRVICGWRDGGGWRRALVESEIYRWQINETPGTPELICDMCQAEPCKNSIIDAGMRACGFACVLTYRTKYGRFIRLQIRLAGIVYCIIFSNNFLETKN